MFKPIRVAASLIFIASIALVLVGAFALNSGVRSLTFKLTRYFSDCLFRPFRFYV